MKWPAFIFMLGVITSLHAAPVPNDRKTEPIRDHKDFLPDHRLTPLPGSCIGLLVDDPAAVLATEGRAGPTGQIVFSTNAASYRWVYIDGTARPTIGTRTMRDRDGAEQTFDGLSMANREHLKRWPIGDLPALVEVEINRGKGSDAAEAFIASKITRIDGTERFPTRLNDLMREANKRFDGYLSEQGKTLDALMTKAAREHLGEMAPTGPREREMLQYLTFIPELNRVQVRFRTRLSDGVYRYSRGIRIDTGIAPLPIGPPEGGPLLPPRIPLGGRFGTQITVETGLLIEFSKTGKVEREQPLEPSTFKTVLNDPTGRRGGK